MSLHSNKGDFTGHLQRKRGKKESIVREYDGSKPQLSSSFSGRFELRARQFAKVIHGLIHRSDQGTQHYEQAISQLDTPDDVYRG